MTRIAINGAAGRMGRTLLEACLENNILSLGAAIELQGHPAIGTDAGRLIGREKLDIKVSGNIQDVINDFDVLIDFTRCEATIPLLDICRQNKKMLVIGTTGFDEDGKRKIADTASEIPVVFAPNMSVGVNLCFKLAELAAKVLADDVDIEIIEAHHRNKVDAPSGTALKLGEVIATALQRDLRSCAVYGREGISGVRDRKTIGFETIRAGDIIGEHTVMFADEGERIEISHKASNRSNFAKGALRAAIWLEHKDAGLYDMMDVLDIA